MHHSRRYFLKTGTLAAASLPFTSLLAKLDTASPQGRSALSTPNRIPATAGHATLSWLEGAPRAHDGSTLGVPWPRGTLGKDTTFALTDKTGKAIPVQTWPLATWPDGSLKWSAHAVAPGTEPTETLDLVPNQKPALPQTPVTVRQTTGYVEVNTGVITCDIPTHGNILISAIKRGNQPIATNGRLVSHRKDQPDTVSPEETFSGQVEQVSVEQSGPVRAVVRIEGRHRSDTGERQWLPFTIRLYFYAGSDAIRMVHSFIYDGDEYKDFISGLGVRFDVPMPDEPYNRHVRFSGEGDGLFGEAVQGITGLRRNPGEAVRKAQVAGERTPDISTWDARVSGGIQYVPLWGDYTLSQLSPDGFEIRKRTKPGHGWIRADGGTKAAGLAYVGGASGGLAFGMRDFWQKYPAQLDIRAADTDTAEATVWLWSPEAQPMDMRFYHDGLGMETHAEEIAGMDITYEDYEKGFGTPHGIARTHEMVFRATDATPTRETFPVLADNLRVPPQLVSSPAHNLAAGVFSNWGLPDRSTPQKARIEDQLDFALDTYVALPSQRRWYGFWDFGDVMHSYDRDRHTWSYDVGGYAWANSELSPDLWLWLSYLRSGRADVFRLAEAMTRHTGEVDVYHLGRFKGLGTRHNVQHWGCSAKQLRISNAAYRRMYYYLTADERVGDLLEDLLTADEASLTLDPGRKIRSEPLPPATRDAAPIGFGTDWGSLAYAWLTQWERTGDTRWRDKLQAGMRTIGEQPYGLVTTGTSFNIDTGEFSKGDDIRSGLSHLASVFGFPELCAELSGLIDEPAFTNAWLDYCILYGATGAEQENIVGKRFRRPNLIEAHSRLTAYAAKMQNRPELAERAWKEFYSGRNGMGMRPLVSREIDGPDTLNPVTESFVSSTNAASQWGLTAIALLALLPDVPPAEDSSKSATK